MKLHMIILFIYWLFLEAKLGLRGLLFHFPQIALMLEEEDKSRYIETGVLKCMEEQLRYN